MKRIDKIVNGQSIPFSGGTYVDGALSTASENPVQNKIITNALSDKAPASHASTATTYGVATTSNYGHTKIINDLTKTSYANGEALSAYQGNLLGNSMGTLENTDNAVYAHAKGEYFVWKGNFVKVTATNGIAAGDAISGKVSSTNLAAVASEINSNLIVQDITNTITPASFVTSYEVVRYGKIVAIQVLSNSPNQFPSGNDQVVLSGLPVAKIQLMGSIYVGSSYVGELHTMINSTFLFSNTNGTVGIGSLIYITE